ncbi:dual specificity phosphatase [Absidia repens]|uniref:protein-tyrosine-phosphatase n=1 Tax=Absidia repens TaxID=90262 RepID=A0A1X2IV35_9FUNG|nr:dual specificity phosphatase [Absidia repens]
MMAHTTGKKENCSSTPEFSTLAHRRRSIKELRLFPSLTKNISPAISPSTTLNVYNKRPQHHPSYREGPLPVLPYLYIGNEKNAHTLDHLSGIDCLLNVAAEVDQPRYEAMIIPWSDKLTNTFTEASKGYHKLATRQHGDKLQLKNAIDLIDQAKKHKKVVLVHCQCGVARSATVVIAYIMCSLHLSLNDAYSFVQKCAPDIGPNLSLLYQLQALEKQ